MAVRRTGPTYSIEPDGVGAYLVRMHHADGGSAIVGGFPTWEAATEWVVNARLALLAPLNGTSVHHPAKLRP
jgi:hypothetical protein